MSIVFKNNIKNIRRKSPDHWLFAGGNCPEPCLSYDSFSYNIYNLQSSRTAHNFNNSRPIYVILWEMRNHYRNIWFMKNSKCQHFLFLKNSPKNGQIFQLFTLYSKGRHFSITKLDILIFRNILHLGIGFEIRAEKG